MDVKDVVKKAYATFASGDMEGWSALHADDLTFTIFGNIPTTGRHVSPQAVIKNVFEPIAVHWPNFNIEHKAIYSDGNMVFVHSDMTADGLSTETLHCLESRMESFKVLPPLMTLDQWLQLL